MVFSGISHYGVTVPLLTSMTRGSGTVMIGSIVTSAEEVGAGVDPPFSVSTEGIVAPVLESFTVTDIVSISSIVVPVAVIVDITPVSVLDDVTGSGDTGATEVTGATDTELTPSDERVRAPRTSIVIQEKRFSPVAGVSSVIVNPYLSSVSIYAVLLDPIGEIVTTGVSSYGVSKRTHTLSSPVWMIANHATFLSSYTGYFRNTTPFANVTTASNVVRIWT